MNFLPNLTFDFYGQHLSSIALESEIHNPELLQARPRRDDIAAAVPKDLWVAKYHFPTSKTVHSPKLTCKELYSGVINSPKTPNPPVLEAPLSVILSVEDFPHYPKASSNPPYPPSVIPHVLDTINIFVY